MVFKLSDEQQIIHDDFVDKGLTIAVRSVAGSGKTTLVSRIAKSIYEKTPDKKMVGVSFTKFAAASLGEKVNLPSFASYNYHKIGYAVLNQYFRKIDRESGVKRRVNVNKYKTWNIVDDYLRQDGRPHGYKYGIDTKMVVEKLVNIARVTDIDADSMYAMLDLAETHGMYVTETQADYAARAIEQSFILATDPDPMGLDPTIKYEVDFADMLYLPIELDLEIPEVFQDIDVLMVDEVQDTAPIQLGLIAKMVSPNTQVMLVGDPEQTIYTWSGVLPDAFYHAVDEFEAEIRDMTYTFRCAPQIAAVAQAYVPHIKSAPHVPDGKVRHANVNELYTKPIPGSLVLARMNSTLVEVCLNMIMNGHGAVILGRDIGHNLVNLMKKIIAGAGEDTKYQDMPYLIDTYENDETERMAARKTSKYRIFKFHDDIRCIRALYHNSKTSTFDELYEKIDNMFSDKGSTVTLSSIHRQKGGEADVVYIVGFTDMPYIGQDATQQQAEEEKRLVYVAVTRAIKELVLMNAPEADSKDQRMNDTRSKITGILDSLPVEVQDHYTSALSLI